MAREEVLDVEVYGGLVRAGIDQGFLTFTAEVGYASGGDSSTETLVNFVGVAGSSGPEARAALRDRLDDALGAAVQGTKIGTYPFDPEHDAALILYEEVGPVNPVNEKPLVFNTTYVKGTVEADFGATRAYVMVLFGKLNEPVEAFRIEGADDGREDTPVTIVSEGLEKDLGIEVDVGIDRSFTEHLRAELKIGYLSTGDAFGSQAEDVFMIRPQVALEF